MYGIVPQNYKGKHSFLQNTWVFTSTPLHRCAKVSTTQLIGQRQTPFFVSEPSLSGTLLTTGRCASSKLLNRIIPFPPPPSSPTSPPRWCSKAPRRRRTKIICRRISKTDGSRRRLIRTNQRPMAEPRLSGCPTRERKGNENECAAAMQLIYNTRYWSSDFFVRVVTEERRSERDLSVHGLEAKRITVKPAESNQLRGPSFVRVAPRRGDCFVEGHKKCAIKPERESNSHREGWFNSFALWSFKVDRPRKSRLALKQKKEHSKKMKELIF